MGEHEKRQNEPIVSFGPYRLDVGNVQLWRGAQEVKLTGKAFAVLHYFVEHPGQLATKDDLFAAAWPETVVSEATLVSGIQELRQALRDDAKKPRYIETVHRRGYRFISEVVKSQYPVVSSQEVASSQHPVVSREERPANEQEVSSVMPVQTGIQGPTAPAANDPPWIPAPAPYSDTGFTGMTQPTSTPQTHNPSSQLNQTPDPEPQPLDASTRPARRSWSVRSLMVMGLVLLVGVLLTVQYLSLPTSSTQPPTPNPCPCLTSLRSSCCRW